MYTGQPENDTTSPTFLLTAAWDSLQIEVNLQVQPQKLRVIRNLAFLVTIAYAE